MKNKKLFIDSISSFLIIRVFLSPSYSGFAMKRSPKMQGSTKENKNVTPQWIPKDQNWKEFYDTCYSDLEASPKENQINSKQNFFSALHKISKSNFNTCSELFKDKNFRELVLSKDGFQPIEEQFHIIGRMADFYTSYIIFLENLNKTTVYQDYHLLLNF